MLPSPLRAVELLAGFETSVALDNLIIGPLFAAKSRSELCDEIVDGQRLFT